MTAQQPVTAIKECRHGRMLFLKRDLYVGRSLDLYGEFSELEAQIFEQIVKPNDVVVEVGANIGAHTVHLARLVGPGGAVLAFEPQRVIFQLLCANVAMNELFNVRTHHAAAGRRAGTLKVPPLDYAAEGNFGGISLNDVRMGEEVAVTPLDSLNLPSLRLLKVDVEGMESEVLEGARQLIGRHRPILYVENDRKEKSNGLIRLIEDLGYAMWWHFPRLFNPENYLRNKNDIFGSTVSINILCVPSETQIVMNGFQKVTGPDDWWQNGQTTR